MRMLINIILALLFLTGTASLALTFAFLDNAIVMAALAALGSGLIVAALFVQLWRVEGHLREHTRLLKFLARQRNTD